MDLFSYFKIFIMLKKASKFDKNKQNHNVPLLSFALSAAIGGALGLLFAPKKGQEMREDVLKEAKSLARHFGENRAEIQHKLEKIFGEVNEDLEKTYIEIKANILASIKGFKGNLELTDDKYEKLVEETVKKFAKGKKWLEKSVLALIDNFKKEKIFRQNIVQKPLKSVASKVTKKTNLMKKPAKVGNSKNSIKKSTLVKKSNKAIVLKKTSVNSKQNIKKKPKSKS